MADQCTHRQIDANVFASEQGGTKPRALSEFEGQLKHRISRAVLPGEGVGDGHGHRCAIPRQNRK